MNYLIRSEIPDDLALLLSKKDEVKLDETVKDYYSLSPGYVGRCVTYSINNGAVKVPVARAKTVVYTLHCG